MEEVFEMRAGKRVRNKRVLKESEQAACV